MRGAGGRASSLKVGGCARTETKKSYPLAIRYSNFCLSVICLLSPGRLLSLSRCCAFVVVITAAVSRGGNTANHVETTGDKEGKGTK